MSGNLKLSLVIEAIDKATAPIRRVASVTQSLAGRSGLGHVTRAAGVLGQRFKALVDQANTLKDSFMAIAGLSVAGFAVGRFVSSVVDSGVEALKASKRTGMAVEQYQRLAYAAKVADIDQFALSDGLRDLQRNMVGAATGSADAAIWFYRAGVSVRGANGKLKPTSQLLEELAERFHKMPDGAKKSALAMGIFGRSGEALIPLLNEGAEGLKKAGREAEALGLVMSEKDAKAAEEFKRSTLGLKSSLNGLFIQALLPVIPALTHIAEGVKEWTRAHQGLVSSGVIGFLGVIATMLAGKLVWSVLLFGKNTVVALFQVIAALRALSVAMLTTPFGLIVTDIGLLIFAGYELYKHWDGIKKWFGGFWDTLVGWTKEAVDTITDLVRFLLNVTFFPFIQALRLVNNLLPESFKNSAPGKTLQGGLDWLGQSPRSTLGKGAAGLAAEVGGTINIKIDSDGRARVTDMRSDNPDVDLNVYTGGRLAASH